jgi:hypothetical protein
MAVTKTSTGTTSPFFRTNFLSKRRVPPDFNFLQPLEKQLPFLRQIGVGYGRANQFVLGNASELSACPVTQKTDTIGIDDVNCIGRNLDQIPIFLLAPAQPAANFKVVA